MKPVAKHGINVATRSQVRPGARVQTIQQHGPGGHSCRTAACTSPNSHRPTAALRQLNPNPAPASRIAGNVRSQPAPGRSVSAGSKAPNYRVQGPIPLGHGSQQIRATIQGTPQVAGSVEISVAGPGRAYISNLTVDQQHRRRGVAAKLIDAAVSTARRQGFKAASLEARPSDNGISPQALVELYRRQGFKNVGRTSRGSPLMERKLR